MCSVKFLHVLFARRCRQHVAVLLLFVLNASPATAGGALSAMVADVNKPNVVGGTASKPHSPRKQPCDSPDNRDWFPDSSCDDDDDSIVIDGKNVLVGMIGLGVTSPFWLPRGLLGDTNWKPAYFARYPYREANRPYMLSRSDSERYGYLLRGRIEYGDNFRSLSHAGGQVLLDTAFRLGIDSEAYFREEELYSANGPATTDDLYTGDLNLVLRFAQSSSVQMRTGIGMNWLHGDHGTDTGFNFTYSGDVFPVEPWVFSGEIDWGRLGDAGLFHGRVTGGVHYHRLELFTGFDHLNVGTTEINSVVAGIRFWN